MADEIYVNGTKMSWGHIVFKIEGERFTGFTSIAYDDKLETEMAYGMGVAHAPAGQSEGKYVPGEVKVAGFVASCAALRKKLAELSKSGKSYGTVYFEGVVQYVDSDETPHTVNLHRCRWVSDATNHQEGQENLKGEIGMTTRWLERDGLVLFNDSQGRPA